jgi:(p)ppGpp synthase/HD superfamily hydrolase
MATLQRAIELAVKAHAAQEDEGEPYILHPMRVMLSLGDHADEDERIVAILHDAVERGELTFKELKDEGFSKRILRAIELLTHDKVKSSYADYVIELKPDALARIVKLADLRDNANLEHVSVRPKKWEKDQKRVQRYALSYRFLTDQIGKSDYRKLMKDAE